MLILFSIIIDLFQIITAKLSELERLDFCNTLNCDESVYEKVCGWKVEKGKNSYKLFDNECLLLKYGCLVDDDDAYGITNLQRCNNYAQSNDENCPKCQSIKKDLVCGIRENGELYAVRMFNNKCELEKYNCKQNLQFNVTDLIFCLYQKENHTNEGSKHEDITTSLHLELNDKNDKNYEIATNSTSETDSTVLRQDGITKKSELVKNIVVIKGLQSDPLNINNTIRDFFAATHVIDMPVQKTQAFNESTRRMLAKRLGPVLVYEPLYIKPKNISDEHFTISSCYHKCPQECPPWYVPVCGVAGYLRREPALMFRNHCWMDAAICSYGKLHDDDVFVYTESTFVFCAGEQVNALSKFIPLIKTLQRMGRMKKKGLFRHRIRNMKFVNQFSNVQPRLQG